MGRVRNIRIRNFRSIGEPIELAMPERGPLVLLGANNVGKSNIVRAIDLLLGEGYLGAPNPRTTIVYSGPIIEVRSISCNMNARSPRTPRTSSAARARPSAREGRERREPPLEDIGVTTCLSNRLHGCLNKLMSLLA
jgi:recombinational DNA repair ATPase RecF